MSDDFLKAMQDSAGGSGEWAAPPPFGLRELNAARGQVAELTAAIAAMILKGIRR